jgi:hypothetical protein
MTVKRACDGCTMCCKMLAVPELQKPMGVRCTHALKGKGCGGCAIYERRPTSCRSFDCLWLTTDLPEYWKPDRSKMVMSGDESGTLLSVVVDAGYTDVWRKQPYYSDLKGFARQMRWRVQVLTPNEGWVIFPEEDLFLGTRKPDDLIVAFGYRQHGMMRQPAVSVQRGDGTVVDVLGGLYPIK